MINNERTYQRTRWKQGLQIDGREGEVRRPNGMSDKQEDEIKAEEEQSL
jgi:hypothetical protein